MENTNPLAKYLKRTGLSLTQFAALSGVSPSYLFRITEGERVPGLNVATRIEKATRGAIKATSWARAA